MAYLHELGGLGPLSAFGLGLAILLAAPTPARACGGTFCDGGVPGPQQMPVDQTGENILFSIGDGKVEAHIQIQYEGDPERFGWIIPVTSAPEVGVGSQQLFDNLLASTVPTFTLNTQRQTCDGSGASFPVLCAASFDAAGDGGSFTSGAATGGDEGGGDGGPEIIDRGFAGAFQYDVLQGGTVQGVVDWLEQAEYVQDDDAPPILEQYLEEDFLFLAIKLRSGAGVDEIHPITVTYEGMEPCIPIRLTAIAAVPDMGIRAFFLGASRVVPQNWAHVMINLAHIDWLGIGGGGTLYNAVVSQAVDEAEEGQAWVTEYAGPSGIVGQNGLYDARWDSSAFIDAEWTSVIPTLEQQGLVACYANECSYPHPLIKGLLQEFFPAPYNVDEESFWSNPAAYAPVFDPETWDGPAFAAALEERIIGPGEHALDLLDGQPYLTRMFTTISPEEMTEDPLFHENADMPDVSNQHSATRFLACEGPDWVELEDGRIIAVDENGVLPALDEMPYAEKIDTIPATGSPMNDRDNSDAIDEALDDYNDDFRSVERGGCGCNATVPAEGILFTAFVFGAASVGRRRRRRRPWLGR